MSATALLLAACGDPVGNGAAPAVKTIVVDSSDNALVRAVDVTLERSARVEVTYWSGVTGKLRVTADSNSVTHHVQMPRLRSATQYQFEVRSIGAGGGKGPIVQGQFHTGTLPAGFAAFKLKGTGTPTQKLTMIELMTSTTGATGAVIVDETGEIVWYWVGSGNFLNGTGRRANGNFVIFDETRGIIELTTEGKEVHVLPETQTENPYGHIHHDIAVTPQNTIYFIARETKPVNGVAVTGEAIWEWSPENNTVVKKWSAFDFMDFTTEQSPSSSASNWLHGNGLWIGPRGSLIVSFRNLDQVISIAPDFKSLDWRLSGPGGTLAMADADRFYGQHSPIEVSPNHILLFDNGFGRPGGDGTSRAIELLVNPTTKTATKVWEFKPPIPNVATRVGSVRRYANGNTAVTFGWGQGSPIVEYEVAPDGHIVWQLDILDGITRMYRATPLKAIGNEVEVSD